MHFVIRRLLSVWIMNIPFLPAETVRHCGTGQS